MDKELALQYIDGALNLLGDEAEDVEPEDEPVEPLSDDYPVQGVMAGLGELIKWIEAM